MSKNNIGPKRLVVGAHYGLKEWIIQRVTAMVMVVFTLVLLVSYLISGNPSYDGWAGLFANQPMKLLTLLAILSLLFHAWVGVRDIWMDYIKPVGLRLVLQVFTIVWLVACGGWAIQVLWRL